MVVKPVIVVISSFFSFIDVSSLVDSLLENPEPRWSNYLPVGAQGNL